MKVVFYTICDSAHWIGCRGDEFVKSFKYWHPDIDIVIFGDKEIKDMFTYNPGLNFYNCKAAFAKLLYNKYDLVVNVDADHIFLGPLTSILAGDYDVACPANYNVFSNADLQIVSTGENRSLLVSQTHYFQGGLIASTSKAFWDAYDYASRKHSANLFYKENDVLNLLLALCDYKVKYLDGGHFFEFPEFKEYYGCASLGREHKAYVENGQIMLYNKPIKAYHFARSGVNKLHPRELFSKEVCDHIYNVILK